MAFGQGFMNTLGTIGGAVLAGGIPVVGPALAGAFIANRAGAGKRNSATAAPPVQAGEQTFAAQDAQTGKGGAIRLTGAVTAQQLQAQRDWAQRELDLDEQRLDAIEAQLAQLVATMQQQQQQQAIAAYMSAQAGGGGLFGGGGGGNNNGLLTALLISGGLGTSSTSGTNSDLFLILALSGGFGGGGGGSGFNPLMLAALGAF